ncbi:retrovirus-related Pol polyprotein from transposon 297 [Elysia marginata]|uniref:Retrovirus-related Pol polyprotein from transposon 297 n=1 Tax=Elysia marginata TaxID=1093978 RepID=A0AAV4FY74_9GAST|nr:retrovirus-related Pol polyprotein from transposon 297 [Elysia marginata]
MRRFSIIKDIKDSISREVTLAYFNPDKPITVQVDASMKALGASLIQEGKPVAFASKALTDEETRYANIERELLAVVHGCERFHTYFYGQAFTVESDHKPLKSIHLKHLKAAPSRLQRMLLRLQPYDLTIDYKPGKEMALADALSRLTSSEDPPIKGLKSTKCSHSSATVVYSESEMPQAQTVNSTH